jgi:outer membrane protein
MVRMVTRVSLVLPVLMLSICAGPCAATPQAGPAPRAPSVAAPPVIIPSTLAALVHEAVVRNLTLGGQRLTPQIVNTNVQAATAAFDSQVQVGPSFGRFAQSAVTSAGRLSSTMFTNTIGGGGEGLLPYSSVSVTGNLPTGTRYSLSLQSTRRSQDPVFPGVGQLHPVEFDNNLTISVAHPLLRGAGQSLARANIRVAEFATQASQAGFVRATEQVIAQVENAYWTLSLARALEAVAQDSLQRAQALLSRNEELVRLQLIADIDVLTARQAVAARQTALTQARAQREDAAEALIFLVYGSDASAHFLEEAALDTAALPQQAPPVADADRAESSALAARTDLSAAKRQLDQAHVGAEVARDGLRPSLHLTGSYTAITTNAGSLLFGADRAGDLASVGWQGGLLLTLPVGNNLAKAGFQQASLVVSQRQVAVAAAESEILADVRQALRAIRSTALRVDQAAESLSLANQEYQAENQRLQLGLSDSFRLLQFEDQVARAQSIELEARFALAGALVAYDLAVGNTTKKYGVTVGAQP